MKSINVEIVQILQSCIRWAKNGTEKYNTEYVKQIKEAIGKRLLEEIKKLDVFVERWDETIDDEGKLYTKYVGRTVLIEEVEKVIKNVLNYSEE